MIRAGLALALWLTATALLPGQARRVVVLKADGLPGWLVERMLAERDPDTGRSPLPWIERTFVERGVWAPNFYSRGVSLSVPSWSILDTGRPMVIHGNVEYDRYTLRAFDYLNFIPFYFKSAFSKAADMPAVELLDDLQVPLLADRFEWSATRQSFQIFQRGIPWTTLKRAVRGPFPLASPRRLIGEWQAGFEFSQSIQDELERSLIAALADEQIRYLDLYTGELDHVAHLDNSEQAQRAVVEGIDALVGRVWSAIEQSPLADETILALVSDHGMNTSPDAYSQGYNLVELFRGAAGGRHHVVTNRHPLADYKLKGLYPFVHKVLSSSDASPYAGESPKDYPTVLLDLDGNERAAISLRNSDLNRIHLLLLQLESEDLEPKLRAAAARAYADAIRAYEDHSRQRLDRLELELAVLTRQIAGLEAQLPHIADGIETRRAKARLRSWKLDASDYQDALEALRTLFAAEPGAGKPASKTVPKRFLGEPNSIGQLQRYAVSLSPGGLRLGADGNLDEERSFERVDYFRLLRDLRVRNVVQEGVGARPVDFVAAPVPVEALAGLPPGDEAADFAVWLYGGAHRQLLILVRGEPFEIKAIPAANLTDRGGRISFERTEWGPGLPLALYEDPGFAIPAAERAQWLAAWRSERDWLRASHRARYANAVVGLAEQLRPPEGPHPGETFHQARRELVRPDLLVLAGDHWNFNARGFNPGGNHGGFLRASAHSVMMLAGGDSTGLRRGVRVDEPYDALSFAPTLLGLLGFCEPDLPGVPIHEAGPAACADGLDEGGRASEAQLELDRDLPAGGQRRP
ncbi:MAG: hypothetical protein GC160_15995 [Acidobacteria bacterium]|nr:hypothetical protein [Acidobacteriota bacterium]